MTEDLAVYQQMLGLTEDLAVKNKCLAITPGTPYDLGSRMEYMYDEHEPQAHMAQIRARAHDPKAYLTTLFNLWCLSHHTLTQHRHIEPWTGLEGANRQASGYSSAIDSGGQGC